MDLPLRLYAEPLAREKLGGACFVLPSKHEDACLLVNDCGLIAVALSGKCDFERASIAKILEIDDDCVPSLILCRGKGWLGEAQSWTPVGGQCQACRCNAAHNCKVPRRVVEGIERYYARQVLEPSIRGFLSILEKQFPRNDLYLFELLQNAVDDGASHVCFKSHRDGRNGLEFFHNGRGFTALDVLGLASVGLSTKGIDSDGPKRTIGFMGVGFKAVYKRYSRVLIHDGRYSFSFQEPARAIPNQPSHGWVLQPRWQMQENETWNTAPLGDAISTDGWCRFQLEKPRGGQKNVDFDLRNLPKTVPPLLGRQSLRNAASFKSERVVSWTLQWENQTYLVTRSYPNQNIIDGNAPAEITWERHQLHGKLLYGGAEDIRVHVSGKSQDSSHSWRFVTLRYTPTREAKAAYLTHTKRPWAGLSMPGVDSVFDETTLFFEIDQAGCPEVRARGAVHAVLPTKLNLPSPIQWQGSWLLSVDRQEVQSVSDNLWNACLLDQIPALCGCLLHCMLSPHSLKDPTTIGARYLKSVLALLPPFSNSDDGQKLSCNILGRSIDMGILTDFCKYSIVPVRSENGSLSFVNSHKAVWLPPCFPKLLPASVLASWFSGLPFASDLIDDHHCWLPLWKVALRRPTSQTLESNRKRFATKFSSGSDGLLIAIRALAALGSAARIDVEKASAHPRSQESAISTQSSKIKNTRESSEVDECLCGDWLPSLSSWPVLPDERGEAMRASELVWLSSDFSLVPPSLQGVLREGAKLAAVSRNNGKSGKMRLQLMRQDVETTLLTGRLPNTHRDSSSKKVVNLEGSDSDGEIVQNSASSFSGEDLPNDVLEAAQHFAGLMRVIHSANVVTPEEACRALLAQWAKPVGASDKNLQERFHGHGHQASRGRFRSSDRQSASQGSNLSPTVLSPSTAKTCEDLFAWAMTAGLHNAMSHLMAASAKLDDSTSSPPTGSEEPVYLIPASRCLIGAEYTGSAVLSDVIRSAGARGLYFVSPRYLTLGGARTSSSVQKTLCSRFIGRAGARTAPLVCLNGRPFEHGQIKGDPTLSALKLRSTQPSAVLSLPLGLGAVNKKHIYEIDVTLAEEWRLMLLRRLPVAAAQQLSSVIVLHLLAASEAADVVTPEMCATFSAVLKGRAEPDNLYYPEKMKEGVPIPNDTIFPALRRALYLPPGQPGATLIPLGPSTLLKTLASASWVPASAPGAPVNTDPSLVLRPCECALPEPNSAVGDLPRACLSASSLEALRKLPARVTAALAWGTVKPKPPVDRVEALLLNLNSESSSDMWENSVRGIVTPEVYQDLVATWMAIGHAVREGRLSKAEENRILQACGLLTIHSPADRPQKWQNEQQLQGKGKQRHQNQRSTQKNSLPQSQPQRKSSSSLWVLPGVERQVLRFEQCVYIDSAKSGSGALTDEQMAALCFARIGVVFDCGRRSSGTSWPLDEVSDDLQQLLRPTTEASSAHARQMLQACCADVDEDFRPAADVWRSDDPSNFRAAYSWALWLFAKATLALPKGSDGTALPPSSVETVSRRVKQQFPKLAVYCRRGPTLAPNAFPARWLPLFSKDEEVPARPVLVDDVHIAAPGCGISRSSMLRPVHKLQPIALLSHSLMRREEQTHETGRLATLDPFLASCIQVPRSSDNKQFTLKVATSGSGELLLEASVRLAVVMQLLQVFREAHGRVERSPMNSPQLLKFNSLTLHFQSPHLPSDEVEKTPTAAVWGSPHQKRSPQGKEGESTMAESLTSCVMRHNKPLLIAGDPEEYAAELEELVLCHVFGRHSSGGLGGASERPTRVLRLLGHLENPKKFIKFLRRDFPAYFPAPGDEPDLAKKEGQEVVDLTKAWSAAEEDTSSFHVLKACIRRLDTADSPIDRSSSREPPKRKRDDLDIDSERSVPRTKYGPGTESGVGSNTDINASNDGLATESIQPWRETCSSAPVPVPVPAAASEAALETVARAAGRGTTILPAWMTSKDGPSMAGPAIGAPVSAPAPVSASSSAEVQQQHDRRNDASSDISRQDVVSAVARGSGRGTTLLPAWMTSKDGPTMAETSVPILTSSEGTEATGPGGQKKASHAPVPVTTPVPVPAAASEAALETVARAAGRGTTILPAWMTSKDGPSMAGPAIGAPVSAPATASAPALASTRRQDQGREFQDSSKKRARTDAEQGEEEEPRDDGSVYVEQLRQKVENFLLSLVIEVVQDSHERRRQVTEQEAADMIKFIVKALLEAA